jgi:DNA-binding PadR family transcriptional regulator
LLVLHLIAERPRHGYEIIKAIEDLAGGAYTPSPGVVYPTLTLLEEIGQVSSVAEGNRKSFTITPDGTAALAADRTSLDAILARIAQVQAQEPALPVVRAMENLRTALRLKLASGATAPELARKIADAIDHTARTIEDL